MPSLQIRKNIRTARAEEQERNNLAVIQIKLFVPHNSVGCILVEFGGRTFLVNLCTKHETSPSIKFLEVELFLSSRRLLGQVLRISAEQPF